MRLQIRDAPASNQGSPLRGRQVTIFNGGHLEFDLGCIRQSAQEIQDRKITRPGIAAHRPRLDSRIDPDRWIDHRVTQLGNTDFVRGQFADFGRGTASALEMQGVEHQSERRRIHLAHHFARSSERPAGAV